MYMSGSSVLWIAWLMGKGPDSDCCGGYFPDHFFKAFVEGVPLLFGHIPCKNPFKGVVKAQIVIGINAVFIPEGINGWSAHEA